MEPRDALDDFRDFKETCKTELRARLFELTNSEVEYFLKTLELAQIAFNLSDLDVAKWIVRRRKTIGYWRTGRFGDKKQEVRPTREQILVILDRIAGLFRLDLPLEMIKFFHAPVPREEPKEVPPPKVQRSVSPDLVEGLLARLRDERNHQGNRFFLETAKMMRSNLALRPRETGIFLRCPTREIYEILKGAKPQFEGDREFFLKGIEKLILEGEAP